MNKGHYVNGTALWLLLWSSGGREINVKGLCSQKAENLMKA